MSTPFVADENASAAVYEACGETSEGGRFVCARPKNHGSLHTDNDNMHDWERTLVQPLDVGDLPVAVALLAWYDHTHGNSLGHDHHCPTPWVENQWEQDANPDCTCGWTGVLLADLRRDQLRSGAVV